jgi:TRAP-type transport system periplasmic protein
MRNVSIVLYCLMLAGVIQSASPHITIKIATLSPNGSATAKILGAWGTGIETKTSGRVKLQFYYSGSQGNERDMINKMKTGQLDGGLFSSDGLMLISKSLCVLELPYLFKSQKEVDYVRTKMADYFNSMIDTAGYALLGWADPGWTYIFANSTLASRANLVQTKMWIPISNSGIRALWTKIGINGTPLGIPEVFPSLQTGQINACFGTYETGISMQWYTKVRYAVTSPIAYNIGVCILLKGAVTGLTEEDRKLLIQTGDDMARQLSQSIRLENDRAGNSMEKAGVQRAPFSQAMIDELTKDAQNTWENQAAILSALELLKKIQAVASEAK